MGVAETFLFVCVAGAAAGTPNYLCKQHLMPSIEACVQATQTFKASPNNATSDKESRVFIYCAPEGNWHKPKDGR